MAFPAVRFEPADRLAARLLRKVRSRRARVAVLGQGYVGLPLSVRVARRGFPTTGFDVDTARVDSLRCGRSYVDDIEDLALAAVLDGAFEPTSDVSALAGFDVAMIAVPTPLRDGRPDLGYVKSAAEMLAPLVSPGALVVLESTTHPGTTEEVLRPILEEGSGLEAGREFFLGYSPERIDPGNGTWRLENTPKVVSGVDGRSRDLVASFYGEFVSEVVVVESTAEAEMAKLIENTFRHVNVALVNELAMHARELGVDIWRALDAAATKPFGFTRFNPGPGAGGHCLPVDPTFLGWRIKERSGRDFKFVDLANEINDGMPTYVVERVTRLLEASGKGVDESRILLLGLAYKGGSSDWRESPALGVAERLVDLGAELRLCDPHVATDAAPDLDAARVELSDFELRAADIVVMVTDHPEFEPARIARRAHLVFDARGVMRGHDFSGEVL